MKLNSIWLAGLMIAGQISFACADPSGSYDIAGTKLEGTAIGDDTALAIGYIQDDTSGVGLMFSEDGKWHGVWSYLGSRSMAWRPGPRSKAVGLLLLRAASHPARAALDPDQGGALSLARYSPHMLECEVFSPID